MRRLVAVLLVSLGIAGCAAGDEPEVSASASPPAESAVSPSEATPAPTSEPSPTPTPSESQAPRSLFGTWRTTLAGQPLSLAITESTYRIVRGTNAATGGVSVDGDRIEFFDSNLCAGTGAYRWTITDGTLSFFPIETEPCPGRAEALLVRYPDYSPPDGG